ncbi:hypothetical protein BD408DRAFT_412242 [Parasitella parasitica]|nr:hypothetical protein BD408DRAFT_412242 [Parasitella parasitica]
MQSTSWHCLFGTLCCLFILFGISMILAGEKQEKLMKETEQRIYRMKRIRPLLSFPL